MQQPEEVVGKYPIITRLFELINQISENQLIFTLKDLLKDRFSSELFKLVIDMSDEQQAELLRRLQAKVHTPDRNDRRKYERNTCLIPLTYVVQDRSYEGYILDISDHGVFIETGNAFFCGHEIIMTFIAPRNQKPLTIIGEIVWSSQNSIGVKFSQLTAHQHKAIAAFSERKKRVYRIKS
jgi:Tfp pilus assembly protein PilZ